MKLKYVSITGADDAVDVADLDAISRDYPFVEWAILLLPDLMGQKRCPSESWIRKFAEKGAGKKAMHLCGDALIGFTKKDAAILDLMQGFKRIQLNLEFGEVEGHYNPEDLVARIKDNPQWEFIIQYTDQRQGFLKRLDSVSNHAILFDGSAGRGVLPESWPRPLPGHFCGYAGGINPDNVGENLQKIERVAEGIDTWIDMESGVRTNDNFDLGKVRRVLEISAPFASNT